eukprot:1151958-Pelagomonas_calceolata.AAC.4
MALKFRSLHPVVLQHRGSTTGELTSVFVQVGDVTNVLTMRRKALHSSSTLSMGVARAGHDRCPYSAAQRAPSPFRGGKPPGEHRWYHMIACACCIRLQGKHGRHVYGRQPASMHP